MDLAGERVIADPTRDRLYVALAPREPANPDSIAEVDATTGSVARYFTVAASPGPMAISGDGRFLYVASQSDPAIDRIDLAAGTGFRIPLTIRPASDRPRSTSLAALPDQPANVLVALDLTDAPNTPAAGGVRRGDPATGPLGPALEPDDAEPRA